MISLYFLCSIEASLNNEYIHQSTQAEASSVSHLTLCAINVWFSVDTLVLKQRTTVSKVQGDFSIGLNQKQITMDDRQHNFLAQQ